MYIIIGASSFIGVHTVEEFLKQGVKYLLLGVTINFAHIMKIETCVIKIWILFERRF